MIVRWILPIILAVVCVEFMWSKTGPLTPLSSSQSSLVSKNEQNANMTTRAQPPLYQDDKASPPSAVLGMKPSTVDKKDQNVEVESSPAPIRNDLSKRKAVQEIKLDKSDALFLHVGKAGGGSFLEYLKTHWELNVGECHPRPCHERFSTGNRFSATTVDTTRFIVALRDPVDRFLSAFYWRYNVSCNPFNEKACKGRGRVNQLEADTLFRTYKENPSGFAESLCSANATVAKSSLERVQNLLHAKDSVSEWLDFGWTRENIFAFVVETAEAAADLNVQLDQAVEWLYESLHFEGPDMFSKRTRMAKNIKSKVGPSQLHSTKEKQRKLSPKAEKCVAEFYRKDYDLLRKHKEKLCKTRGCLAGIDSILRRRSALLSQQ